MPHAERLVGSLFLACFTLNLKYCNAPNLLWFLFLWQAFTYFRNDSLNCVRVWSNYMLCYVAYRVIWASILSAFVSDISFSCLHDSRLFCSDLCIAEISARRFFFFRITNFLVNSMHFFELHLDFCHWPDLHCRNVFYRMREMAVKNKASKHINRADFISLLKNTGVTISFIFCHEERKNIFRQ